jgi:hypothetical protein
MRIDMPANSVVSESPQVADFRREIARLQSQVADLSRRLEEIAEPDSKRVHKPFDFYSRVQVISKKSASKKVRGKHGTILGRAPGRNHWIYTVFIDDENETWSLSGQELRLIGDHAAPSAKPSRTRIKVDSHGRGYLAR